MTNLQTLIKLI